MLSDRGRTESVLAEAGEPYPFDWVRLVSSALQPAKVEIVEALARIGRPLSANDLEHVFENRYSLSLVSYHLRRLAEFGALEEVENRQARGGAEHPLYFFADGR